VSGSDSSAGGVRSFGSRGGVVLILLFWSIAFGYLEGAVVIYLREIFYPNGFAFPLTPIPHRLYIVELLREAATLLLLLGVALLSSRRPIRRFAAFAFCFGVWDIVFYLTLKFALGWPASILEWDILFLIPVPWVGPVLAPVLVSFALIAGALWVLLHREEVPICPRARDWAVEALAGALILASFFRELPRLAVNDAPRSYPWWLLALGLALGLGWLGRLMRRGPGRRGGVKDAPGDRPARPALSGGEGS